MLLPGIMGGLLLGQGGGGGGGGGGAFTADQLTPVWIAHEAPSTVIVADGAGGAWDETIREIGNVLHDPDDTGQEYKVCYSGHSGAYAENNVFVGYAHSSDGENWTKGGQLTLGAGRSSEDPWLIKVGATYYLYVEDKEVVPFTSIRLYTSTDFATWTDQGDILAPGTSGAWDDRDVSSPVVWREGSTWHMVFEGRKSSGQQGAIGHATSSDGSTWAKDGSNPVIANTFFAWTSTNEAVVCDDLMIADDGSYVLLLHVWNDGDGTWRPAVAHGSDLYTWSDPIGRSVREAVVGATQMQFHPIGADLRLVHHLLNDSGIRLGRNMGYEVLKVNFTGADGSSSFTDESLWAHAITANGNAQILSNKLELDGAGDYASLANEDEWFLSTADFTIELFGVEFDVTTALMSLVSQQGTSAERSFRFDYRGDLATDILRYLGWDDSNALFFDDSAAFTPSGEHDICFERAGNTLRYYVDGAMSASATVTEKFRKGSSSLLIGATNNNGTLASYLDGRIAALRFTNGEALYDSDAGYTVPSLPL